MTSPPALVRNVYYHIFNRGVNRENIFVEERNYSHFLRLYAKYIEPVAETYAYCLLRNHFHVLVRIKSESEDQEADKILNPSQQFSNFFNAYAKAINKAYGRTGSLFQHPFGRVPVKNSRQFYQVVNYIHRNPQKHKIVNDFKNWKYSFHAALLSNGPTYIKRESVLDWFGTRSDFIYLHASVIDENSEFDADDAD